ncbi:hypothetical protein [Streptomyces sp. AC602_WCS936]|uniref:hypothetical protein n=1 Tax=Streptomyces sp. AC602_WCS936 TaxID=2823685 RepID=UPI0020B830CC|nr:hypothetical protein [Streptomyces sp. AC602_WCS936]
MTRATRIFADGHQIGGVSDLSSSLYPPGTPAHIAYYRAVDDIEARTEAATAAGAQLVLAPFDAGDCLPLSRAGPPLLPGHARHSPQLR